MSRGRALADSPATLHHIVSSVAPSTSFMCCQSLLHDATRRAVYGCARYMLVHLACERIPACKHSGKICASSCQCARTTMPEGICAGRINWMRTAGVNVKPTSQCVRVCDALKHCALRMYYAKSTNNRMLHQEASINSADKEKRANTSVSYS